MLKRASFLVFILILAGVVQAQSEDPDPSTLTPDENLAAAVEMIDKRDSFFSALPYLRAAADAGNVRAQTMLAEYLDYGEQNAEAEMYFGLAVAQNDPAAKLGLAVMHIAKDVKNPDLATARRLIEEAADQEYGPAVRSLANAYINGGLGLADAERNSSEALTWITRAGDLNEIPALVALEDAYRTGKLGLSSNVLKANEIRAKINQLTGVKENQETGRRRRK